MSIRDDDAPILCARCGATGVAVWKACSDVEWRILCVDCDLKANAWLLNFLNVTRPTWRLNRYSVAMDRRPVTHRRLVMAGLRPLGPARKGNR